MLIMFFFFSGVLLIRADVPRWPCILSVMCLTYEPAVPPISLLIVIGAFWFVCVCLCVCVCPSCVSCSRTFAFLLLKEPNVLRCVQRKKGSEGRKIGKGKRLGTVFVSLLCVKRRVCCEYDDQRILNVPSSTAAPLPHPPPRTRATAAATAREYVSDAATDLSLLLWVRTYRFFTRFPFPTWLLFPSLSSLLCFSSVL
jgi:hypothetical protein